MRELLKEKGFGTRAQGDATVENYVSGGDAVKFLLSPAAYSDPAAAQLQLLTMAQPVAIDGKIFIPYVGPVFVLGMTEAQLAQMVKELLRPVFKFEIDLQARISGGTKGFFAYGEVGRKGFRPILEADLTILKAMALTGWTDLGNLSRVHLIRPDAEHPLVMEINIYEMLTTGYTARNVHVRENDIIYVPPTFLGLIARILERALTPVSLAVRSLLGIAQVQQSYEIISGQRQAGSLFFRF